MTARELASDVLMLAGASATVFAAADLDWRFGCALAGVYAMGFGYLIERAPSSAAPPSEEDSVR